MLFDLTSDTHTPINPINHYLGHTGESLRVALILNNQSYMGSVVLSHLVGYNSRSL